MTLHMIMNSSEEIIKGFFNRAGNIDFGMRYSFEKVGVCSDNI